MIYLVCNLWMLTIWELPSGGEAPSPLAWELLSDGEKTTVLYAVIKQYVNSEVAASFLASIDDPALQDSSSKAEVSWKYVKAAYEEIRALWSGHSELVSADEAHTMVKNLHICDLSGLTLVTGSEAQKQAMSKVDESFCLNFGFWLIRFHDTGLLRDVSKVCNVL